MHRRDAAQHKFDHGNRRFPISLIPLGLATEFNVMILVTTVDITTCLLYDDVYSKRVFSEIL